MENANKAEHVLHRVSHRTAGMLNEARHQTSDMVDQAKDRGQELLDEVKDRSRKLWSKTQDLGNDTTKEMEALIRKYPKGSVGIAFVVGVMAYAFFTRKNDANNES